MPTLQLSIRDGCDEIYVDFAVDGHPLSAIVRAAPRASEAKWIECCLPWHGGDYDVDETVLGKPARTSGLHQAYLFVCGCGQIACGGAVVVDVQATPDSISFQNFALDNGYFPIAIPPIVFDRSQFEAAITDLERQVAEWTPPPPPPPRSAIPLDGRSVPEPDIHPDQEC
jgi:hypothetical protein